MNQKLLILDEPTAGVDIELRRDMWEFLRELNEHGTTIILTTHYFGLRNIAQYRNYSIRSNDWEYKYEEITRKITIRNVHFWFSTLQVAPVITGYPSYLEDELTLVVEVERDQGINAILINWLPRV